MPWRHIALAMGLALAGCANGPGPDLGGYDIPRDPAVASAPCPRLIDVPEPPPPGSFTPAAPDPADGQAVAAALRADAARMRARAAELAGPVLTDAERRRLTGR
jgi:hypothetical protein